MYQKTSNFPSIALFTVSSPSAGTDNLSRGPLPPAPCRGQATRSRQCLGHLSCRSLSQGRTCSASAPLPRLVRVPTSLQMIRGAHFSLAGQAHITCLGYFPVPSAQQGTVPGWQPGPEVQDHEKSPWRRSHHVSHGYVHICCYF